MRAEFLVEQLSSIKKDNSKIKKEKEDMMIELNVQENESKCTQEKIKEMENRLKKINQ